MSFWRLFDGSAQATPLRGRSVSPDGQRRSLATHTRANARRAEGWLASLAANPDEHNALFSEEPEAEFSSIVATSSPTSAYQINAPNGPVLPQWHASMHVLDSDSDDPDWIPSDSEEPGARRAYSARTSTDEKTLDVLSYMKERYDEFSLRDLLRSLFTSKDQYVKKWAGYFLKSEKGVREILDAFYEAPGSRAVVKQWVVQRAGELCSHECGLLTDHARRGRHWEDAQRLRVHRDAVTVELLKEFSLPELQARYSRLVPSLHYILRSAAGCATSNEPNATPNVETGLSDESDSDSDSESEAERVRPPMQQSVGPQIPRRRSKKNPLQRSKDLGCTSVISQVLNLRSRATNYHAVINGLILWQSGAPKRLIQTFNRLGFSISYLSICKCIKSLSRDAVRLAQAAARDPSKVLQLIYDNFNWQSKVWEKSSTHGTQQHDQVSAILVSLRLPTSPEASSAAHITDPKRFDATLGERHRLTQEEALSDILPSPEDSDAFRSNAILHVAKILATHIKIFNCHCSSIPDFYDPKAIPPHKTESYYLPTLDQEQGSTRGNMIVLLHYFTKILSIPLKIFETKNFWVLGDRLTTARDRAAQDQRNVDRSSDRVDHLSSFPLSSGLMHVCLNQISCMAKNFWGGSTADAVSLITLRDRLPNHAEIGTRKIDFYAWLRFLNTVASSLVLVAAASAAGLANTDGFAAMESDPPTYGEFMVLCKTVVDRFVCVSPEILEVEGVKKVLDHTSSGHAVLLLHDLMLLREMRDAIKHGHASRVHRVLRYWMPMFYAGGSYNYSNELMELLHNLQHDWPSDSADVALGGMLHNRTGKPDGFCESDLTNEHLNGGVKEKTDGANATPALLATIAPAIGHVHDLTERVFADVGTRSLNEHHAKVKQQSDIDLLVKHLTKNKVFDWVNDKKSKHNVHDLFREGCLNVAGPDGGHAKHLARHRLRFRTRHASGYKDVLDEHRALRAERDLLHAQDNAPVEFDLADPNNSYAQDIITS